MSGLVAILGPGAGSEEAATLAMLGRLRYRGGDQQRVWSEDDARIGVTRAAWELAPGFAGGVMVLEEEGIVVAADASLYYLEELRRGLRAAGQSPRGDSPSHLIAAAYRAWGSRLVEVLEGDYAFLVWDRRSRVLCAARDFAGSRPLYFGRAGTQLVLASTPVAVTAHPGIPRTLNRLAIAEDLIGASSMVVGDTPFEAVQLLPAGARLLWEPGKSPRVEGFWEPPVFERNEGPGTAEAAEQLRALLRAAVRERLAPAGPTAVWTSGGYDSPAVLGLALSARGGARGPVLPVSMSYPAGDPGREDELIQAVAAHLSCPVHWVDVASVPGLPDPWAWAERREEPFAHPYEEWNRALAAGSRDEGARVILGGNGGDQFFGVSPVFMADLLRQGRWGTLWSEARRMGFGRRDARQIFHWIVQPALPPSLLELATRLRGRPLRAHLQSPIPDWLRLDRATTDALWQRQWQYRLRRPQETFGSAETAWYLTSKFGQRIATSIVGIAQQSGVEPRSPMYDRRVIEFMARRPREDRYALGETKILLRRALEGVLPAEHLAPRKTRTGLPTSYLNRARNAALPAWLEAAGKSLQMEELGITSRAALEGAMTRFLKHPEWEGRLAGQLFNVLAAEFWIRRHTGPESAPAAKVA
ncbi:MAG: asparagine synthase-related protein [Gemmatimonadales bacterium]